MERKAPRSNGAYAFAECAQLIIYAVGTGGDGNKAVLKQQRDVLELLNPWKGKMQCIADANGKKFYHPLCPTVHCWQLEEFDYNELKAFNQLSTVMRFHLMHN